MGRSSIRYGLIPVAVLCIWLIAMTTETVAQPQAPLSAEQIVQKLEQMNRERAEALHKFEGTRVYRMQYRGFPGNRDAEMTVTMRYEAPNTKKFTVISQSGSKFLIDHVFKRLLEGEQEATSRENRQQTALNTTNYDFTLAGYEDSPEGGRYVLNTIPKSKNKFLYVGKIWVDAKDFAVVKIEAAPAKSPSFWIKKTEIRHTYTKVDDFWFPAENHSQSYIRLGGEATLSIEYKDYKIGEAGPLRQAGGSPENANVEAAAAER